jgi:hypothetical protein
MKNTLLKLYQNQIFIWLCYLLVASLIYFRVFNNFFASDDFHWLSLAKNRPWDWSIFVTNYEGLRLGGSYNPVLFVLWKMFFNIFSLHYQWYHIVSMLLHASNAWLVYVLAKKILAKNQPRSAYWASLCGLFFLIWPVQIEAISWIAAWPHLWATLFYLASLIFYIKYFEIKKKSYSILALVFFILALFTKEIAITLPVALFFISWHLNYKIAWKKLLPFFLVLIIFLFLRLSATGQFFGYYGQANLAFKALEYLGNLAIMFLDWATGYFRVQAYKVWYRFPLFLAGAMLVFLLVYILYLWRSKKRERFFIFALFILSCLPVLPLGMHRTTFAGERYLYLPTVFFVIWFFSMMANLRLNINKKMFLIFFMAVCSMIIINDKNIIWSKAAILSQKIVASYADLHLEAGTKLISVALPDNVRGAEVFRNNLQQALELYYPKAYPQIVTLPIYVQLREYDANSHLLWWRSDEKGWFLESVDRSHVATGLTSITVNRVYFELRNYNYQNFTSNLIRLIPEPSLLSELKQGTVQWLTFDQGRLVIK